MNDRHLTGVFRRSSSRQQFDDPAGLGRGAGAEYAINNSWSLKAEYLYLDFGNWSYTSGLVTPAVAVPAGYTWTTSVRAREHIARIGVNYRFGDPSSWRGIDRPLSQRKAAAGQGCPAS